MNINDMMIELEKEIGRKINFIAGSKKIIVSEEENITRFEKDIADSRTAFNSLCDAGFVIERPEE